MPKRRDKAEPPGATAAGAIVLLIVVVYAAFPQLRNWAVVVTGVALGFL